MVYAIKHLYAKSVSPGFLVFLVTFSIHQLPPASLEFWQKCILLKFFLIFANCWSGSGITVNFFVFQGLGIRYLHSTSTSVVMESSNGNSFQVSPETEKFLCERLMDQGQPISERFRVLFSLRNLRGAAPRNALIHGISLFIDFSYCF